MNAKQSEKKFNITYEAIIGICLPNIYTLRGNNYTAYFNVHLNIDAKIHLHLITYAIIASINIDISKIQLN